MIFLVIILISHHFSFALIYDVHSSDNTEITEVQEHYEDNHMLIEKFCKTKKSTISQINVRMITK